MRFRIPSPVLPSPGLSSASLSCSFHLIPLFAMLTFALAVPALADVTPTEATPAADVTAASTTTHSQRATAPRKLLLLPASNPRQLKGVASKNCTGGGSCGGGSSGGSSGGGSSGMDKAAILEEHNKARRAVGVADLSWDDNVAAAAKQWADELASSGCKMKHGAAKGLGQNLYWKRPAQLNSGEDRAAVRAWVAEKADWTYSAVPNGCAGGKQCGHYTQVVWRGTQRVGCAAAQCADGGGMWVCDYSPQGNMVGSAPY
ncbi:unnamed protein product [Closterium sp. Naga37s-1]|nr:unnamed protein product [Closterium sp. Naga37s-1]